MLLIILTLGIWTAALLLTEFLWHRKILRGEYARKTVHILISTSIAFTPYYLSWDQIQILGAIGLACAIVVRFSGWFKSTYDIKRKSWGEIIGPLSILVMAFLEPPAIIFVAVMLHTGLADGIAAIVGTKYGKGNRYHIFGYAKSVAGTSAFFITSVISTAAIIQLGLDGNFASFWPMLLIMPLSTTAVENIGVYGADNALITFTTALIFYQFILTADILPL